MKKRFLKNSTKAFSTLVSIIIVGAVALSIAITVLAVAVDNAAKNQTNRELFLAKNYAQACAERALNTLRLNLGYTGGDSFTFTYGGCTVTSVTGTGNTNRNVNVTGTSGNATKKITVVVGVVTPSMTITSWDEVQ